MEASKSVTCIQPNTVILQSMWGVPTFSVLRETCVYAVDLTTLFLKGILGMSLMVGRSQDDMTDSRQPLSFAEHFEFYHFSFFFFFTYIIS